MERVRLNKTFRDRLGDVLKWFKEQAESFLKSVPTQEEMEADLISELKDEDGRCPEEEEDPAAWFPEGYRIEGKLVDEWTINDVGREVHRLRLLIECERGARIAEEFRARIKSGRVKIGSCVFWTKGPDGNPRVETISVGGFPPPPTKNRNRRKRQRVHLVDA